jgi:hypothetical protein
MGFSLFTLVNVDNYNYDDDDNNNNNNNNNLNEGFGMERIS